MPDDAYGALLDDLRAEREVIERLLASLPDGRWDVDSPAEGWTLRDCVVHLCETDDSAAAGARGETLQRRGEGSGVLTAGMLRSKALTPDELRAWYRRAGEAML